ncbi:MAG: glycerate kinase, partial [Saprospiraceae bacterium]|nr:glycerate kinase [Saprospiraceae bacterium]
KVIKELKEVQVKILCDVDNPLYGPRGAAHVYAAQKGADEAMIMALDAGLEQFATVIRNDLGKDVAKVPGSGAAGGLGAGSLAFLNAELTSGIEYMLAKAQLEQHLRQADLLFTGEGSIDAQSSQGKLISGLSRLARQEGVPVIALCGRLSANATQIEAMGLQAAFSIQQEATDLAKAIQQTASNLEKTAFQIGRLISM